MDSMSTSADGDRRPACDGNLVYGPVSSRRLGRSLGVDLVPFKTCTCDCVYCQLGRTTDKTRERARWAHPMDVLEQVAARLGSAPDVIALAGSGEPTLDEGLQEVVDGLKRLTEVPVAVITNGSLLGRPDVQRALAKADVVLPSLDAFDEASYLAINRPCEGLDFAGHLEGMVSFRDSFAGSIWLEVMLLEGLTDTKEEVSKMADLVTRLGPDRVQLNTVVRPPATSAARPVAPHHLTALATMFSPHAEVIARPQAATATSLASGSDVLSLIARRPCTAADVTAGLGIHRSAALKKLAALTEGGHAETRIHGGDVYYVAADKAGMEGDAR